ncbi:MAG TPA: sirohydrochlorin chelatase [Chloroflexota bacterium]
MARRGVVLLGHGTKDPQGVSEFLGYAEAIRARSGEPVFTGVLEFPSAPAPDIQTAFDQAAEAGLDEITALPALLFFAGHTQEDMPDEVARARTRHPDVQITLGGPLGGDPRLLRALEDRLAPFAIDGQAAVLMVGRGSLISEANSDLFKTARKLWDRNAYGWVEAAFVSIAPPYVPQGIERCLKLGARRVVVIPYFLNTGVLVKRIAQQAMAAGAEAAPHLGLHPLVIDILLERLAQARAGICPCQAASDCRMPSLQCSRGASCLAAV